MLSFPSQSFKKTLASYPSRLDRILSRFSYGLAPLAIILLTLVAIFGGDRATSTDGSTVEFRTVEEPVGANWTPQEALQEVRGVELVSHRDTRLSEQPFWILVDIPLMPGDQGLVEFASRHAQEITCWDVGSMQPIGNASRHAAIGQMELFRSGFALLPPAERDVSQPLLCRALHTGPARITVQAWPASDAHALLSQFHRGSGLLEGALVTLALFILFAAAVNRETRYVLLAVWLIGNLRLAAISTGWDTQWLGWTIPPDWIHKVRSLTIATYYIVTYTLFGQIFKEELERLGSVFVRVGQSLGFLLLIVAALVPFSVFLPVMWVIATLGSLGIISFLIRCIVLTGSRNAMWFGAALALVLFASFSEVIAAAFGFKGLIGSFNSVTAAIIASLMAAMAFANQIRNERRERLRAQEELQHTYNLTPVGLFTLDESGRFVRINNAMRTLLALSHDDHRAATWSEHFGEAAWEQLQVKAGSTPSAEVEIHTTLPGAAEPSWFLVRVARLGDLIEGSLQDITERHKLTERFRFLANNDPLTGVLNRRGIERRLAQSLEALHVQPQGNMAVAYLDLDRFKLINDLYGHQTGDEILKQVCERIREAVPGQHAVGRIGGDEFILVMDDIPISRAAALCEELIARISTIPYRVRSQAFHVKVSIGLIEVDAGLSTKDVISAADRACREAKQRSNGVPVIYEKHASAFRERAEELQLIQALGGAFSPQGLFLMMQPIMSLHDPTAGLDFEVLVRMRGNDGSVIPAGRIIAAAEVNGNISALDLWIITTTLEWIRAHLHRLRRTRFICVNVSGSSLNDEAFLEKVIDILGRYREVAHFLCFEITEGVALHDIVNSRRFIERLRRFGSRIALDDFGAGYTSFLYLKDLAADALKIDGSFIRSLNEHPSNVTILEAIVQLARNLGMRTVAEWVEDPDTLEILVELGIDYAQGYAIAAPMPPETLLMQESAADFATDPRLQDFIKGTRRRAPTDDASETVPPQWYH